MTAFKFLIGALLGLLVAAGIVFIIVVWRPSL